MEDRAAGAGSWRSSGIGRNPDQLRSAKIRELWGRLRMFVLQEILWRAFQPQSDTT